jgi:hypothetical protein
LADFSPFRKMARFRLFWIAPKESLGIGVRLPVDRDIATDWLAPIVRLHSSTILN